jgi:hypothetical protein
MLATACGKSAVAGAAVGTAASGLSAHRAGVPRGADACAFRAALDAQPGRAKSTLEDTCKEPLARDKLWSKAMQTLSAYGQNLNDLSMGADPELSGGLAAQLTGVRGSTWIEVSSNDDKAARDAVAQLVNQMSNRTSKDDVEKAVGDAAPHVKTICKGLDTYLGEQVADFQKLRSEIEDKQASTGSRRCLVIDTRSFCVGESVGDRLSYASIVAHLAALERNHAAARDELAGFCAAHESLAQAAGRGDVGDEETYGTVVSATRTAVPAKPVSPREPAANTP